MLLLAFCTKYEEVKFAKVLNANVKRHFSTHRYHNKRKLTAIVSPAKPKGPNSPKWRMAVRPSELVQSFVENSPWLLPTELLTEDDYDLWITLMKLDERLAQSCFTPADLTEIDRLVGEIGNAIRSDAVWPYLRHGPNLEAISHWAEQIRWLGTPTAQSTLRSEALHQLMKTLGLHCCRNQKDAAFGNAVIRKYITFVHADRLATKLQPPICILPDFGIPESTATNVNVQKRQANNLAVSIANHFSRFVRRQVLISVLVVFYLCNKHISCSRGDVFISYQDRSEEEAYVLQVKKLLRVQATAEGRHWSSLVLVGKRFQLSDDQQLDHTGAQKLIAMPSDVGDNHIVGLNWEFLSWISWCPVIRTVENVLYYNGWIRNEVTAHNPEEQAEIGVEMH